MPLILAIEPDRRQASNLAAVLRARPRTEVVMADSASRAVQAIATRVPDVLLTSPLLSARDETVLADWLRNLGPAGARVQALTIPILAPSQRHAPKKRGVLSVLGRRKKKAETDGCAPDAFVDQVDVYLKRTAEDADIAQLPVTTPSRKRTEAVEPPPELEAAKVEPVVAAPELFIAWEERQLATEIVVPATEPESLAVVAEPVPVVVPAEPESVAAVEPEPIATTSEPELLVSVAEPELLAAVPTPEPNVSAPVPEPEPLVVASPEPQAQLESFVATEPESVVAAAEPEAIALTADPEPAVAAPEPEPIAVVTAPEPEPLVVASTEPQAEAESFIATEPESVVAAPEPEPVAVTAEPEPVVAMPEPIAIAAEPEPEPLFGRLFVAPKEPPPQSEPFVATEPESVAAAAEPVPVAAEGWRFWRSWSMGGLLAPEPVAAVPEPEPEPIANAVDPEPEPLVVASQEQPAPEIVAAAIEAESLAVAPEPEPVAITADPEPVEPVVAVPEPMAMTPEPEPLFVASQEAQPEPESFVATEAESAAVAAEPEPVFATAEPEPVVAVPPLEPIAAMPLSSEPATPVAEEEVATPALVIEPVARVEDDFEREWIWVPLNELVQPWAAKPAERSADRSAEEDVWVLPPVAELELLSIQPPIRLDNTIAPIGPIRPVELREPLEPLEPIRPPLPVRPLARAARAKKAERKPLAKKKAGSTRRVKPVQDEWGFFDPDQCGFAALLDKLDEIERDSSDSRREDTTVRVISY